MTTARFIVADVFDGLNQLADNSVDLIVSSPPFLAVRSYLPADHPDKHKEIGGEPTPAEFIDTLLHVVAACDRVLAPHGSLCFELGDTYCGAGGYGSEGSQNPAYGQRSEERWAEARAPKRFKKANDGWPLAKSKCLIPEAFALSLAYGINVLTGQPSPAGQWRIRNQIAWCRTNPPVGALGDKWRPAHSTITIATRNTDRYWDDVATRVPASDNTHKRSATPRTDLPSQQRDGNWSSLPQVDSDPAAGAPLRDWWIINNNGYEGAHYATYPPELVIPLIQAMTPQRVCTTCGKPSRRITETTNAVGRALLSTSQRNNPTYAGRTADKMNDVAPDCSQRITLGWTDCGHNNWRRGVVLDPFAGTGTTLLVANGHGHDAVGIDIDLRNADHARERCGMFLEVVTP